MCSLTPDQIVYWGPRIACGLILLLAVNTIRNNWRHCRRFGSLDV